MSRQLEVDFSSDETVVKSNRLVKAKTPFSKLEHRVVASLIAQIEKGQEEFDLQSVSLREIIGMSEVNSTDLYRNATEICDRLAETTISIRTEGPEGGRKYTALPMFTECTYVENQGLIQARFNKKMGDYLLDLSRKFTMYGLPYFLRLPSRHAMRIYELLKMREGLKRLKISVGELREVLSIEDKYEQFYSLRRHVLDKSRTRISENTDIEFTYEVIRDGRTPVRVVFYIRNQVAQEASRPAVRRDKSFDYDQGTGSEGVHLRPKTMFKSHLSPSELSDLEESDVESLYQEARSRVEEKSPDASSGWKASEIYRIMKKRWEGS